MVLAGRRQPREKLGRGGALVRLRPAAGAELDQRVRLFGARRHDAARTVILEAAPDQHLVVGEKRRGQRVAREAAHPLAVEGEVDGAAAVDQPSAPCETRAHL